MKVRGERECKTCGTRWSYYETGEITCPECGSIRSVGVDEPTEHTASAVELNLTDERTRLDEGESLAAVVEDAADTCAEYCRKHGFVHAGELQELSATYLAAMELKYASTEFARSLRPDDEERLYVLTLLRGADRGERPAPEDVPASMYGPRGLAMAAAIDAYARAIRRSLDDDPDPPLGRLLGSIGERRKRIEALDGELEPHAVERLVTATREAGQYLIDGDEAALARARERLAD
jgi:uncharacterized Zn finger protein (UPF0148 family)